jgi:hypothetical protein
MWNNQSVQLNSFIVYLGSRILKVRIREGNLWSLLIFGIDLTTCILPVLAWVDLTYKRVDSLADSSIVLGLIRWAIGNIGPPYRASEIQNSQDLREALTFLLRDEPILNATLITHKQQATLMLCRATCLFRAITPWPIRDSSAHH